MSKSRGKATAAEPALGVHDTGMGIIATSKGELKHSAINSLKSPHPWKWEIWTQKARPRA